jgi:hypothetical protein
MRRFVALPANLKATGSPLRLALRRRTPQIGIYTRLAVPIARGASLAALARF